MLQSKSHSISFWSVLGFAYNSYPCVSRTLGKGLIGIFKWRFFGRLGLWSDSRKMSALTIDPI